MLSKSDTLDSSTVGSRSQLLNEPTPQASRPNDFASYELESSETIAMFPTWRFQLGSLFLLIIMCVFAPIVSHYIPLLVLKGRLFDINGSTYYLTLPIFILAPGFVLGKILITAFDSQYIIDDVGVEARIGLVSFSLRQPRLRYEDIRGVEPKQTLIERMLGIGSLLVGSAMMSDVEIVMEGIPDPRSVQQYINRRREIAREKRSS